MKAARYSEYGGPEVIQIVEMDKPEAKDGQVVVGVRAAAINPFDWKLRAGYMKDFIQLNLPITIGADFAGVVTQAAGQYKEGDEVFGSAIVLNGGSGAVAECAAANIVNITTKPANVSAQEAAALVLTGVSAIQALNKLGLGEGKKVLIHGGAGGIGTAAIQYAKHLGAHVATTVQAKDKDYVAGLGADQVIDYETEHFDEVLKDFDAVFDTVGGDTYVRSFKTLKTGGTIISMVEQTGEATAKDQNVNALYQSTNVNTESLNELKELVEAGVIKPHVDREFPLDRAADAFRHLESGHPQGKVVITIK